MLRRQLDEVGETGIHTDVWTSRRSRRCIPATKALVGLGPVTSHRLKHVFWMGRRASRFEAGSQNALLRWYVLTSPRREVQDGTRASVVQSLISTPGDGGVSCTATNSRDTPFSLIGD